MTSTSLPILLLFLAVAAAEDNPPSRPDTQKIYSADHPKDHDDREPCFPAPSNMSNVANCGDDLPLSMVHARRIEHIKENLLSAMGESEPPLLEPFPMVKMSPLFWEIYNEYAIDEDYSGLKTTFVEGKALDAFNVTGNGCIKLFQMGKISRKSQIKKTYVTVNLEKDSYLENETVAITIYGVHHGLKWTDSDLIKIEYVNASRTSDFRIKLPTAPFQNWYANNLVGLYVKITQNGKPVERVDGSEGELKFIIVDYVEEEEARQRRAIDSDSSCDKDHPAACCLHSFHVNFTSLGWKFVLAPLSYNAFLCAGDCSKTRHAPRLGHHKLTNDHAKSCCHPSEYSYLKIMYQPRPYEIQIMKIANMVARRCGCT